MARSGALLIRDRHRWGPYVAIPGLQGITTRQEALRAALRPGHNNKDVELSP